MKTNLADTGNPVAAIIPLPGNPKRQRRRTLGAETRFKILEFLNRGGSKAFRVTGSKRDGTRIRENFPDEDSAKSRRAELEAEFHARTDDPGASPLTLRATRLTDAQLRLCESALAKLDDDDDLLPAVSAWVRQGKAVAVQDSPRLDDAADRFIEWLDKTEALRDRSKSNLKNRVNVFRNNTTNLRVSDVDPAAIEEFFSTRSGLSTRTKVAYREAISRFFSWCAERPREWVKVNPCKAVKIERQADGKEAAILSVEECGKLLAKTEAHRRGRLAPYIAVCLFGGLRPTEAQRLTWDRVNLEDKEIRIEAQSSKRKKPRLVSIGATLAAWLKRYKNKPFCPANMRRDLEVIKHAAGYTGRGARTDEGVKAWPPDVLRHTAISHMCRNSKSYIDVARWAGNSEGVIRQHYEGRVTSEDTKAFYALLPKPARKC